MAYRLTLSAEAQIEAILEESVRLHGLDAARRYSTLIVTAMAAIGDDPRIPGSIDVPRLTGIRAYPTRLIKMRVEPRGRVRTPPASHRLQDRCRFDRRRPGPGPRSHGAVTRRAQGRQERRPTVIGRAAPCHPPRPVPQCAAARPGGTGR